MLNNITNTLIVIGAATVLVIIIIIIKLIFDLFVIYIVEKVITEIGCKNERNKQ